jgi:hypothetical protein
MIEEEFKEFPLPEYKNRYKVSSLGKIWSKAKNDYIKISVSNGHNVISINKPNSKSRIQLRVDTLIAETFLGKSEKYLYHKDNNLLNDNIDNLEYIDIPDYLKIKYKCHWKPIKKFENYFISTNGDVWSLYSEDLIKSQVVSGYKSVNIGYPKQLFKHIHRLVAESFINNENNYPVVNHIDEDKMNNVISNLEWTTSSENRIHSLRDKPPTTFTYSEVCEEPENGVELEWLLGYLICDNGTVYSKKTNRFLKQHLNDNGYYRVYCNEKYYYTHRLVAETFLEEPLPNQTQVNHKNLIRLDNSIDNLEWISPSENNKHSLVNNPEQYKHLQKKVAQLDYKTGNIIKIFDGIKEAGRTTKTNSGSIVKVCKKNLLSAGGFKWKYM